MLPASGLSSSALRLMESLLVRKDSVHMLISDESSADQMLGQFIKKFGIERVEEVNGQMHFANAFECGHVYGAIKQMVDAFPDKEVNIYLDVPSMMTVRIVGTDAQIVLNDKPQSVELENLLAQNPNVVVRVATLRPSANQMVAYARATGSLKNK
jgi:hypothetical protein